MQVVNYLQPLISSPYSP